VPQILLAQISGIKNLQHVTCENFGKVLAWFGPGVEVRGSEKVTFLNRMRKICSEAWFHGNIDTESAFGLINGKSIDHFLVRLSTQPGCFTIQTLYLRVRIIYKPNVGFQEEITQKPDVWYPDLSVLIKSWLGTKLECGNSVFSSIYGNKKTSEVPIYGALHDEALNQSEELKDKKRRILVHTDKSDK